jgi:diguanylate cyclase (GGDEF)-like protein
VVGPSIDYAARRRFAQFAAVILITLTAAALAAPRELYPGGAWFSSALLFAYALLDAIAGLLLLGHLPVNARKAVALIAFWTLGSAAITSLAILYMPHGADQSPGMPLDDRVVWLHAFGHLYVAVGALLFAATRARERPQERARPTDVAAWAAAAFVVAAGGSAAVLAAAPHLPALLLPNGTSLPMRTTGIGIVELAFDALAIAVLWRRARLHRLDHAVALNVLAIGLSVLILVVGANRFTIGYYIARLLDSIGPLFILMSAATRLLEASGRLSVAATVIDRTQRVAVRQTRRLATIWRLAGAEHLSDAERFQALLDASAGTIRPGRPFFGEIGHLEGDVLVLDASSDAHAKSVAPIVGSRFLRAGARVPLAETLQYEIAQAGATISFSDLNQIDHRIRRQREHSTPFNSFIGTQFSVGSNHFFVAFASTESLGDDQFTEDDHAFIDVLASFLATQLQRDRQLAQIRYQIEHDNLTGLPSRAKFRAAAIKNISLEIPSAIAIVALDRFREINDTFGHMTGDALLVEIAAALRGARQSGDYVARLGGDNFAILIDDVAGGIDLESRIQNYRDVFARPIGIGDRDGKEALHVGATFGVALYPQDATSFDELLARADAAVDLAKGRQRGTIEYFNTHLQRSIERRRSLHVQLAAAVEHSQFTVRYQPTVELWNRQIIGAEALVRWQHPQQGLITPDDFIPFAESNGLIRPIGSWVLTRVIDDLSTVGPLPEEFTCYINLSGHQFGDLEFVAAFREQLAKHPQLAGHMGIEITETVAMSDVGRTLDALALLRELGATIALDDFGTGYSSLSYLKRFPIDIIKIDKSFVRGLPHDQHDVGLVETVIAVASRFGFKTLAEGIETIEQYDWLRARGCTYGQGYLIARPMTFTEFVPWLSRRTFISARS